MEVNGSKNYKLLEVETNEAIDLKELFLIALRNWYWFIVSCVVAITLATLYILSTIPVYEVNASAIIEDQSGSGGSGGMAAAAAGAIGMDLGGLFSSANNFDNELEILQSRSLILSTVKELDLYISQFYSKSFADIPLYDDTPLSVWLSFEEALKLESSAEFTFIKGRDGVIKLELAIGEFSLAESITKLPTMIATPHGRFTISCGAEPYYSEWTGEYKLTTTISDPQEVAESYMKALTIAPSSKTTTIADISLRTTVKQRGVNFINKLIEIYNRDVNDEKNISSSNSAYFIDERIAVINSELTATEQKLESFKRDAGITDLESEAKLALTENTEYNRQSVENKMHLQMVTFLKEYALDPKNQYELLPVNIAMTNPVLMELIVNYNEMLFERSKLLRTSFESSPSVMNITMSLDALLESVLSAIESVESGLIITQEFLNSEAKAFEARIASAPTIEREFLTIAREQEIQSAIYLMLLQMREENALALAATVNNARIFDEAYSSRKPVAPRKIIVLFIALVLGGIIPLGVVYLKEMFKFHIEGAKDLQRLIQLPIAGVIPHIRKMPNRDNSIAIVADGNDSVSEALRSLRANILFALNGDKRVILVTSTTEGEGKSFISANTAVSLALMGKKVALVGLDIRRNELDKIMGVLRRGKGLTSYLSGECDDIKSLITTSTISPNLSIIYGGDIPSNPSELLLNGRLEQVIELLRGEYDYIVLDAASVKNLADTLLVAHLADISLFVSKAYFTLRSDIEMLNSIIERKRLPEVLPVIVGTES